MDSRTSGRGGYSRPIGFPSTHKAANDDFGRFTGLPKGPVRGVKDLACHAYTNIGKHRVLALAAGVTFYSILAIFPAIAALLASMVFLPIPRPFQPTWTVFPTFCPAELSTS
jgi:membrane protein